MKVSTMTQFIMLMAFSIMLNFWHLNILLLFMVVFLILFTYQKNLHFFRLIKRLKWFFLVMFLIFLFNTPGEHMTSWVYSLNPTYEGLREGMKQMLRIALMLAALSLMLLHNTMQQLIAGFYYLLKPLNALGIDIERFAARLCLTMDYVEQQQLGSKHAASLAQSLPARLNDAFAHDDTKLIDVTLEKPILNWFDYMVISVCFASLVTIILLRG